MVYRGRFDVKTLRYSFGENTGISEDLKSFSFLVMIIELPVFRALKYCNASSKSVNFDANPLSIILSVKSAVLAMVLNFLIFSFTISFASKRDKI